MSASPPLLRAEGLVHRYRSGLLGRRADTRALDRVDLELWAGEVLGVVGESGSGKTTLVRCLLGLLRPEAGRVEVLGRQWAGLRGGRRDRFRRRVQPLFQDADAHLDPAMTVRALLRESARIHQPEAAPAPLVAGVLEVVGLSHRADALPHELSGGERRRAGIARLLLCRPELVLADEPTAGLDAARKPEILALLRDQLGGERGLLVVSHDLAVLAAVATRLVVMLGGRVVEELPREALGRGPHHPHTTALLQACGLLPEEEPPPAVQAAGPGCPLSAACPLVLARCATERPSLARAPGAAPDHRVACHALAPSAPQTTGGAP